MEDPLASLASTQPRRLSALSLTSVSTEDAGSSACNAIGRASSSAAWRSPATPIAPPTPDNELTCTPEDAAAAVSKGNGTQQRRVTFVDQTPVRLPYRRVHVAMVDSDGDAVAESAAVCCYPSGDLAAVADAGTEATATAASVLAAPQRGTSLRLQARLNSLRAEAASVKDDDNPDRTVCDAADLPPVDPDDPRLAEARARAANAAPFERVFAADAPLPRADLSAGSVERVAVAESAWSTRRPPRRPHRPSAQQSQQPQPPPPDPAEHWRPDEAIAEPDDLSGGGLFLSDAAASLVFASNAPHRRRTAGVDYCDSLTGGAMRRWAAGKPSGLAWRRNFYF